MPELLFSGISKTPAVIDITGPSSKLWKSAPKVSTIVREGRPVYITAQLETADCECNVWAFGAPVTRYSEFRFCAQHF